MARRVFKLRNYQDYFTWIGKSARKGALNGLHSAALRLAGHIQTVIIPQTTPQPVDRGVYKAGWGPNSVSRIPNGAAIWNTVTHAVFIEDGVKNVAIGRAMVEALAEWAKRKGLAGTDTEATSVAWAIAKRLAQTGIFNRGKGLKIFERASKELPTFIREEVIAGIKKELRGG